MRSECLERDIQPCIIGTSLEKLGFNWLRIASSGRIFWNYILVAYNVECFIISWATVSFSRIVVHGVAFVSLLLWNDGKKNRICVLHVTHTGLLLCLLTTLKMEALSSSGTSVAFCPYDSYLQKNVMELCPCSAEESLSQPDKSNIMYSGAVDLLAACLGVN